MSEDNQIQRLVEQLYESEGLTDALTDEAATLLLNWGEQQLQNLAHLHLSQTDLDSAGNALQRAMRTVNRLIEQRADLSDTEMVEHLLKLVEQVITITSIAQQAMLQEGDDDQKAAKLL
jgi:Na+/phosphate symporter